MPSAVDPVICSCLSVSEAEVREAIDKGAATVAEVGQACEAGTGCTTCHPVLLQMLEDAAMRQLRKGEAPDQIRQLPLFGGPASGPGGAGRKPK